MIKITLNQPHLGRLYIVVHKSAQFFIERPRVLKDVLLRKDKVRGRRKPLIFLLLIAGFDPFPKPIIFLNLFRLLYFEVPSIIQFVIKAVLRIKTGWHRSIVFKAKDWRESLFVLNSVEFFLA